MNDGCKLQCMTYWQTNLQCLWRKRTVIQRKAWWRVGRSNQQAEKGDTGRTKERDNKKKRKREGEEKYRSSFFDMLLTTVKKSFLILWLNGWQFQSFSYVVHDFCPGWDTLSQPQLDRLRLKFCTVIHGPQVMSSTDFGNLLTFSLAPPLSKTLLLFLKDMSEQVLQRLLWKLVQTSRPWCNLIPFNEIPIISALPFIEC